MEEEFRAVLTGDTAVTSICPAAQINFGRAKQGAGYPRVGLTVISNTNEHTMKKPDSLLSGRFQVDIYADSYMQMKLLERAIKLSLDGYTSGNLQGIFHETTRERIDGVNEAEKPFSVSIDFLIKWSD